MSKQEKNNEEDNSSELENLEGNENLMKSEESSSENEDHEMEIEKEEKEKVDKPEKKDTNRKKNKKVTSPKKSNKFKDNKIITENEGQSEKHYSSNIWKELFVKNLSYTTSDKGLADFFSKYGDVEETKIVYDKKTNKSKGVGFCRFYEPESALKAMNEKDNLELDGRKLKISYSNERPNSKINNDEGKTKVDNKVSPKKERKNSGSGKNCIFVANLNFNSNEKKIEKFFEGCGKILDIRLCRKNGRSQGFAHVDFDSKKSMEKAMKKHNCRLDGRRLRLEVAGEPNGRKDRKKKEDKDKEKNEEKEEIEENDEE